MNRECQHVRDLLDSYLSDELLVETNHLVLRHLETCDDCRTEASRRQRTRRLLAQTLETPIDAEPLRKRITAALDKEPRGGSRLTRYWGAAAGLAAAVAIAFWFTRPVDAAAYTDSVGDHVQCALTLPAAATYNPKRIAARLKPPFAAMTEQIPRTYANYELIDAHTCPFNGRQYGHAVYRTAAGQILSVFAEPALRGGLPSAPAVTTIAGTDIDVYSSTHDRFSVNAASSRNHHVFVVSDRSSTGAADVPADLVKASIAFLRSLER